VANSQKFLSLDHYERYGRAWWIAGLEKLSVHGDTLIWTGPDASAGVYLKSGTLWVRSTRAVPDTIVQSGNDYVRKVLGGGEVHFTSSGFHTKSVDRNGDETLFNHSTVASWNRLSSVVVPKPSGADTVYTLHYNPTSGTMDSVRVRNGTGGWGTYRIWAQKVVGQNIHVDSIKTPDGVKFGFIGAHGQITSIFGPRGDTTAIAYGHNKVATVTVKTADVADVVLDYRAAQRIGRTTSGWNAPKAVDSVSTRIDGALSGAADTTRVFVTGWGAVRGVRDAFGTATWIDRQDLTVRAFPTRVRYPNGLEVTTAYTSVGLPDTIIDRSTGAVTTYQWNNTWRAPTSITSAQGVVASFTYDGSGNLLTRTVGTQKDSLHYDADKLVDAAVDALGRSTTFGYDSRGNLAWAESPAGFRTRRLRDYLGRDTLVVTPLDVADSVRVRLGYDVVGRSIFSVTRNDLDAKWDSVASTYDSGTGDLLSVAAVGGPASSATDSIGTSTWQYDGLGRVTVAETPVSADTLTYDLAGRVTEVVSNNGDTITMTYDVLGRMLTRRMSKKTYSYGAYSPFSGWNFPVFDTLGLTLDTMTAVYTYDGMGNLLTANNAFSHITRTYALNGAQETDQQAIRSYGSGSFSTHVYDLAYWYDRDGRRAGIQHPTWLAPGDDLTTYAYETVNGRLASVRDALGDVYGFAYNTSGQPTVLTWPGGVDSLTYDAGGRLSNAVSHFGSGSVSSTPSYLGQSRVSADGGTMSATYDYDGFGHLVGSEVAQLQGTPTIQYFERDAFGNATSEQTWNPTGELEEPGSKWDLQYIQNQGGRQWQGIEEWDFGSVPEPDGWEPSASQRFYDTRGNQIGAYDERFIWDYSGGAGYDAADTVTHYRSYSKSYWDAGGYLRVHQINRDSIDWVGTVEPGDPWGA
jgi:YD repeat-containing protein